MLKLWDRESTVQHLLRKYVGTSRPKVFSARGNILSNNGCPILSSLFEICIPPNSSLSAHLSIDDDTLTDTQRKLLRRDTLNRMLKNRPNVDELVQRNIIVSKCMVVGVTDILCSYLEATCNMVQTK